MIWRTLLLSIFLLMACGGGRAPAVRGVARSAAHEPERRPPAPEESRPWAELLYPAGADDSARSTFQPVHGQPQVVIGPWRVDVSGREPRIGQQRFGSQILYAAPCDDGAWIFVSRDLVASADSFTGALQRVVSLPTDTWLPPIVDGSMLTLVSVSGRAFVGRCGATLAPLDGVREPVLDVRFAGGIGLALTQGGQLLRSTGGPGWERVPLGTHAARVLLVGDGIIGAETTAGNIEVGPNGHSTAAAGAALQPSRRAPPSPREPLEREVVEAAQDAVLQAAISSGPPWALEGRRVRVTDASGSRLLHGALPRDCHGATNAFLLAWGETPLIGCGARLFTADPSLERLRPLALRISTPFLPSDDGRHLALAHGCDGHPDRGICLVDAIAETRTTIEHDVHPAHLELLDIRGSRVLVQDRAGLHVLGADGYERHLTEVPDGAWRRARMTHDGLVYVTPVSDDEAAPPVLMVWDAEAGEGAFRSRSLPEGAWGAALSDRTFGVAAGGSLDRLWVTEDGGANWQVLRAEVDGDPAAVSALPWCPGGSCPRYELTCGRTSCDVWGRVRVHRVDRRGSPAAAPLVPTLPVLEPLPEQRRVVVPTRGSLRCHVPSTGEPDCSVGSLMFNPALSRSQRIQCLRGLRRAQASATPGNPTSRRDPNVRGASGIALQLTAGARDRHEVRWAAHHAGRLVSGRSQLALSADGGAAPRCIPQVTTRRAVVMTCRSAERAVYVAENGRAASALRPSGVGSATEVVSARRANGGAQLVVRVGSAADLWFVELDERGAVRRAFAYIASSPHDVPRFGPEEFQFGMDVHLAGTVDAPMLLVDRRVGSDVYASDDWWLVPVAPDERARGTLWLRALTSSELEVCTGPIAPGAPLVPHRHRARDGVLPDEVQLWYELRESGTCLRRVENLRTGVFSLGEVSFVWLEAASGQMVGHRGDARVSRPLACQPQ